MNTKCVRVGLFVLTLTCAIHQTACADESQRTDSLDSLHKKIGELHRFEQVQRRMIAVDMDILQKTPAALDEIESRSKSVDRLIQHHAALQSVANEAAHQKIVTMHQEVLPAINKSIRKFREDMPVYRKVTNEMEKHLASYSELRLQFTNNVAQGEIERARVTLNRALSVATLLDTANKTFAEYNVEDLYRELDSMGQEQRQIFQDHGIDDLRKVPKY